MRKTAIITGANGGIGSRLATAFRSAKWRVIGTDIRGTENRACHHFFHIDISKASEVREFVAALKREKLVVHCLINNAAIQIEKPLVHTTEEEWQLVLQTNLSSVFFMTKYLFPLMRECSVINISSVHARATSKGMASYVASKGGVSALTRVMALELADSGMRVNAILPGAIDTEMLKKGLQRNARPRIALENLVRSTPLKKIGEPHDVAQLALFLADNAQSKFITGQEFICDGGVLARLASE